VGIATDSLIRIFLLIPCGLSSLFFSSYEEVFAVFTEGAIFSYIEDLLFVVFSLLVGVPLLMSLSKQGLQLRTAIKRDETHA
jgi:pilus assembly protein TadC